MQYVLIVLLLYSMVSFLYIGQLAILKNPINLRGTIDFIILIPFILLLATTSSIFYISLFLVSPIYILFMDKILKKGENKYER